MPSSPALAWPPEDLGQPRDINPHIVQYDFKNVPETLFLPFHILRSVAFGLIIGFGILTIFTDIPLIAGVLLIVGTALLAHVLNKFVMFPLLDKVSARYELSAEEQNKLRFVYNRLFDVVESNTATTLLMAKAMVEGKIDLKSLSAPEALHQIAKFGVEQGVAQADCTEGHAGMCVHKAPSKVIKWFTTAAATREGSAEA